MTAPFHGDPRTHERLVEANGVELCLDVLGERTDPAILLVSGLSCSLDWWHDDFCRRLVEAGRFVMRYDHRDTGRSVSYPPGAPPYTGADLTRDAVGILDRLGIERVHLVGHSAGGGIVQEVAADHPGRVVTLTLMSTSPALARAPGAPALPSMTPALRATFDSPPAAPDWSDRTAVVDYLLAVERPYFAPSRPVDEDRFRRLAGRIVDRTADMAASTTNHWAMEAGPTSSARLADLTMPTLVVHGLEDPLFPYAHGEALAAEIPHAELLGLEATGHEMPPPETWDVVIPALVRHTATGV